MSILLRITAIVSLLWSVGLVFLPASVTADLSSIPLSVQLVHGLVIANLGFAYLFWRAAANPYRERSAIYTALIVLGLGAADGIYAILYLPQGDAVILALISAVVCLVLFVATLSALPATLRPSKSGSDGQ